MPKSFWVDSSQHLVFPINSVPCHTTSGFNSPNVISNLPLVDPTYLHPFGCLVWYKVPEANRKNLDPKGRASILLSYLSHGNGYRVWHLQRRVVIKSRDVIFRDDEFPYNSPPPENGHLAPPPCIEVNCLSPDSSTPTPSSAPASPRVGIFRSDRRLTVSIHNPSNSLPPHLVHLPADVHPEPAVINPTPARAQDSAPALPRRSGRTKRAPERYGARVEANNTSSDDIDVPKTLKQVLCSPNKTKWVRAADEEFTSLIGMSTWKLVPRLIKRKIIRSKWVFKPKFRPNKSILKLKARLVAMGFTQEKGIDFDVVFAPTTRAETLRLVLSLLGAHHKLRGPLRWGAYQVDFKTAFFNSKLDHPIYMSQAPGFEDPDRPDDVYEVTGSLYGLKQSPRQWNKTLHDLLISIGLIQSKFDPTLYFKFVDNRLACAISVHVDDLAVIGEEGIIQPLMDQLEKRFKVGQREELHHFLSLKITRDPDGKYVYLSQAHYIDDLCAQFFPDPSLITTAKTPIASDFKDLGPKKPSEHSSPGAYSSLSERYCGLLSPLEKTFLLR